MVSNIGILDYYGLALLLAYKNLSDIFILLPMTHKAVVDKKLYTHWHQIHVSVSSDLMYSPISAWWKQTAVNGSACLHSAVLLAATPKPNGKSDME